MASSELGALQQAVYLNEWQKLQELLAQPEYASHVTDTFSAAQGYKGNDGRINLLHYSVYCDAFNCAEVLLKVAGPQLHDKPTVRKCLFSLSQEMGNRPTEIAKRIFVDNFVDLFNEYRPPKVEVPPKVEPSPPLQRAGSTTITTNSPTTYAALISQIPVVPIPQAAGPTSTTVPSPEPSATTAFTPGSFTPSSPGLARVSSLGAARLSSSSTPALFTPPSPSSEFPIDRTPLLAELHRLAPTTGNIQVLSHENSFRAHKFVLVVRCPILAENHGFCSEASSEAVESLLRYLYLDDLDFTQLSIPSVFELWCMALDLQLRRLELLIQSWVRTAPSMSSVVEIAQCMHDFNVFAEYRSVLLFVKANSTALKPVLMQNRTLALNILKANEADYPQQPLVVPAKTLQSDLAKMLSVSTDIDLVVLDSEGIRSVVSSHYAVLFAESAYFRSYPNVRYMNDPDLSSVQNSVRLEITIGYPISLFKSLLSFMYTGQIRLSALESLYVLSLKPQANAVLQALSLTEVKDFERLILPTLPPALIISLLSSPLAQVMSRSVVDSLTKSQLEQQKLSLAIESSPVVMELRALVESLTRRVTALEQALDSRR